MFLLRWFMLSLVFIKIIRNQSWCKKLTEHLSIPLYHIIISWPSNAIFSQYALVSTHTRSVWEPICDAVLRFGCENFLPILGHGKTPPPSRASRIPHPSGLELLMEDLEGLGLRLEEYPSKWKFDQDLRLSFGLPRIQELFGQEQGRNGYVETNRCIPHGYRLVTKCNTTQGSFLHFFPSQNTVTLTFPNISCISLTQMFSWI